MDTPGSDHRTDSRAVDFTVVIPCFRSGSGLADLVRECAAVLDEVGGVHEILLIEDGSGEENWQFLTSIAASFDGSVRAIRLSKNFGQHNATLCGFGLSLGRWVFTIDDDSQSRPTDLALLIETARTRGLEVVYGAYSDKQHAALRNLGTRLVGSIVRATYRVSVTPSSFRLVDGELARSLSSGRLGSVYLDGLILSRSSAVGEVPVVHRRRIEGESGYSFFDLMSLLFRFLFQHTTLPLSMMSGIGFLMSAFSFCATLFFGYRKLIFAVPLGYTSLISAIFLTTGLLILCLSILGEYVRQMVIRDAGLPAYRVVEITDGRAPRAR